MELFDACFVEKEYGPVLDYVIEGILPCLIYPNYVNSRASNLPLFHIKITSL
jgi:hypothetical protein